MVYYRERKEANLSSSRIKSPFALRTTVGNVTRSRYTVFPLHRTFTSIRFRVSRSLSFAALFPPPSPSSFPRPDPTRLDSTRSFRKTQPPRKTILSHNFKRLRPALSIFRAMAGNLNSSTSLSFFLSLS